MSEKLGFGRRHFLSVAAIAIVAGPFSIIDSAEAQSNPGHKRTASLEKIKQLDAGLLNIGYADIDPSNGSPVILLQGRRLPPYKKTLY